MKFFGLVLISASLCLNTVGCSDSADQTEAPPPPPPPSETDLGDAAGNPEDMFDDSAADDESDGENAPSAE